jgi:hypothetical protein
MKSSALLAALAVVAVTPTVAAHRLLLTAHDFPSSWTSTPPTVRTHPVLTCAVSAVPQKPVKERAVASSPSFAASNSGPFVTQTAWIYRTDAQVSTVWKRAAPQLRRCFVQAIQQGSTKSVTFTVKSSRALTLPHVTTHVAGYHVVAQATTTGQTVDTYYDMLVLAHGTAITELSFARLALPVPRALELRVARLAARRLGGVRSR